MKGFQKKCGLQTYRLTNIVIHREAPLLKTTEPTKNFLSLIGVGFLIRSVYGFFEISQLIRVHCSLGINNL